MAWKWLDRALPDFSTLCFWSIVRIDFDSGPEEMSMAGQVPVGSGVDEADLVTSAVAAECVLWT